MSATLWEARGPIHIHVAWSIPSMASRRCDGRVTGRKDSSPDLLETSTYRSLSAFGGLRGAPRMAGIATPDRRVVEALPGAAADVTRQPGRLKLERYCPFSQGSLVQQIRPCTCGTIVGNEALHSTVSTFPVLPSSISCRFTETLGSLAEQCVQKNSAAVHLAWHRRIQAVTIDSVERF